MTTRASRALLLVALAVLPASASPTGEEPRAGAFVALVAEPGGSGARLVVLDAALGRTDVERAFREHSLQVAAHGGLVAVHASDARGGGSLWVLDERLEPLAPPVATRRYPGSKSRFERCGVRFVGDHVVLRGRTHRPMPYILHDVGYASVCRVDRSGAPVLELVLDDIELGAGRTTALGYDATGRRFPSLQLQSREVVRDDESGVAGETTGRDDVTPEEPLVLMWVPADGAVPELTTIRVDAPTRFLDSATDPSGDVWLLLASGEVFRASARDGTSHRVAIETEGAGEVARIERAGDEVVLFYGRPRAVERVTRHDRAGVRVAMLESPIGPAQASAGGDGSVVFWDEARGVAALAGGRAVPVPGVAAVLSLR